MCITTINEESYEFKREQGETLHKFGRKEWRKWCNYIIFSKVKEIIKNVRQFVTATKQILFFNTQILSDNLKAITANYGFLLIVQVLNLSNLVLKEN